MKLVDDVAMQQLLKMVIGPGKTVYLDNKSAKLLNKGDVAIGPVGPVNNGSNPVYGIFLCKVSGQYSGVDPSNTKIWKQLGLREE